MRLRLILHLLIVCLLLAAAPAPAAVKFNDPMNNRQWYLDAIHMPEAWSRVARTPRRSQVTIAVVDSGFDMNHPDLRDNFTGGFNVISNDRTIKPVHPHGTATAGLIGAISGNRKGISGAAWTAKVLPVQITNRSDGLAHNLDVVAGVRYAVDQGARVVNISYEGVNTQQMLRASHYAARHGAVLIMAAGNDGQRKFLWEDYPNVIAVGAIGRDGRRSRFSNRGEFLDLLAPGEGILTLKPDKRYGPWTGTSFSAPLTASVAAMMLSVNPDLAPQQVRQILFKTADDMFRKGRDRRSGHGLVNAEAAVLKALQTKGRWGAKRWQDELEIVWDTASLEAFPGLTALGLADDLTLDETPLFGELNTFDQPGVGAGATIPEPATLVLLASGALLIARRVQA